MFESLQEGLGSALRALRGRGKLTESNMREGLRAVQTALLEADVSFPAAREFMARVSEQAVGERVLKALNPTQQLVGIVHQELINLMGPVDHSLRLKPPLSILMLCGLQGSGKTTTCGKLGRMLVQRGKKPMLVAADLQRPAAITQLEVLGERLGIPVYAEHGASDPVAVCRKAVDEARRSGAEVVILDTAGRLHVDEQLMQQLSTIERRVQPDQVYFVVDSMTGQDAVNSAKAFNEALELDGVILTKLDGDARGGAALSVKAVTGVPIKFIGTGEHLDSLEEFHPDRMAGRILGMGDILSLVEQAHEKFDQEEAKLAEERLRKGEFTLDDFRKQLSQVKKLGPLNKVLGMLPGMGQMTEMMGNADAEGDFRRLGGIIDSMTPQERGNPKLIDQSRRRRIAAGAGVEPHEVNELVKQYDGMADLMKRMSKLGIRERMKAVQEFSRSAAANPGGRLVKQKQGTGKRLTPKEKAKLRRLREKEERRRRRQERNK
ncbi:MAG: signal recognition particle protein [Pirellulaceae bacterium]|jgi:signal recognition particle subunit SRP54|nr:signal recognition particle protein [Thermoguttaceae bacterium]NLZ01501.1 signal recognition particle protein [Pirellulaceae bacterium]